MNSNEKNTKNSIRKTYGAILEIRDFEFLISDEDEGSKITQMLIDRNFLLPSGLPNEEAISENAKYFAQNLAKRLSRDGRMKHFGLQNIVKNVEKFNLLEDFTAQYFYICYLYGSVNWRVPYNVQRLGVAPDALGDFLNTFTTELIEFLNNSETEEVRKDESE